MTLKDIPTYITYKSISTSHQLCSGLCEIVLVFRSLIAVHDHIYTYTKYKHTCTCKYNTTLTWILSRLILYNSTIWLLFCCIHLKQWYNKMSKKTLRVNANILSIANLAIGTPPPFPIPKKYRVKSWINA